MMAGSLSAMPGKTDGADERGDASRRNADLPEALLEPRPLGGAADQAHIGKVARKCRGRDGQIERMVVGHDQDEGIGGRLGDLRLRIVSANCRRILRDMGRERHRAGCRTSAP